MVHVVAAPGLAACPYFHRYTDDALDLCDVLSSFSSQAKATLHELCRVMDLPGKPDGMSGAEIQKYYRDGHIREIAEYCESDVLNTYRVWLRYVSASGYWIAPHTSCALSDLQDIIGKKVVFALADIMRRVRESIGQEERPAPSRAKPKPSR
jgi:hypothetical protein